MCNKYNELVRRMMEIASRYELDMANMEMHAQSDYMQAIFSESDAVFLLLPSAPEFLKCKLYVAKGADVLAGSGFDLTALETVGSPPALRKRRLKRKLKLSAFLVDSYLDARYIDISFGDSKASIDGRRFNRQNGGRKAIVNMRLSCTPAGRAYLKSNRLNYMQ